MQEWVVSSEESGLKILVFLKSKFGATIASRQLKRALEAGQCQINGRVERFASKLVGRGDRVSMVDLSLTAEKHDEALSLDSFLYVDDHLIACNKPVGINSEDSQWLAAVRKFYKNAILLHRLDRDTTGVLLFARNEACAEAMFALFKQRQISKTYHAIVDGVPKLASGVVDNFLGKIHTYQGQSLWGAVAREKGMYARTQWRLERSGHEAALLVCHPETGRTHQIRVHLSGLGHPILGDFQYGRTFRCSLHVNRMMLHATSLNFVHPITKQPVVIRAPFPQDFKAAVERLFGEI